MNNTKLTHDDKPLGSYEQHTRIVCRNTLTHASVVQREKQVTTLFRGLLPTFSINTHPNNYEFYDDELWFNGHPLVCQTPKESKALARAIELVDSFQD